MWVLLLVVIGLDGGTPSMTTAEFSSEAACKEAGQKYTKVLSTKSTFPLIVCSKK